MNEMVMNGTSMYEGIAEVTIQILIYSSMIT